MVGRRAQIPCGAWSPCWGWRSHARVSLAAAWLNQSCAAGTDSAWRVGARDLSRGLLRHFICVGARVGLWPAGLRLRGPCAPVQCVHPAHSSTAHITGRPTRTHTCRRRLRRNGGGPVAFNVMWHWRRMRSAPKFIASFIHGAWATGTFPSENCAQKPISCLRRFGAPAVVRAAPGQGSLGPARLRSFGVGVPAGLRQSEAMPPCSLQRSAKSATASHNWSLGRDAPQQAAASRLVWRARQLRRYMALASHA